MPHTIPFPFFQKNENTAGWTVLRFLLYDHIIFIQEAGNRSFPYVYHSRLFPGTALCGIGTAGTEYAAARGIQRTRQLALQYNALFFLWQHGDRESVPLISKACVYG